MLNRQKPSFDVLRTKLTGSETLFNRASVFQRASLLKKTPEQEFSCDSSEVIEILNRNFAHQKSKNFYN